jgi:hypothetical protein
MSSELFDLLRFVPEDGTVIRTPEGEGYGYWVGGHKVSYDAGSGTFALFYRRRTPLERGRGGTCAVAVSADGIGFDDVWGATKEDLASTSIEVGHPVRHGEEWRLYLSYEYAPTGEWRIDVLRADAPERFSAQHRRTVLHPRDFGMAWIKDPVVYVEDGATLLYAEAPAREGVTTDGRRVWAAPQGATVLAESSDGLYFPSLEYVFEAPADDSWHGRRARINSVFPWAEGYVATFDGGRTSYDNYEEWAGLATSPDRRRFTRLDSAEPWVRSPHGCVRYVYGLVVDDRVFFYYEFTRPDGSHDLRVAVVERR